ncbi:MAG: ATP-binding protein [Paracoccaceae bacterium]
MQIIEWHIKSTTLAPAGALRIRCRPRLRTASSARNASMTSPTTSGAASCGRPAAGRKVVLLIDEIDSTDIEFPNDLLQELDRMEFHAVYETGELRATHRPVSSHLNNEKELPDAFSGAVSSTTSVSDMETMKAIAEVHHPGIKDRLPTTALAPVHEIHDRAGLEEALTSEVLDWLKLLLAEDLSAEDLVCDAKSARCKLHGALKNEQDVALFERLAFMARGER